MAYLGCVSGKRFGSCVRTTAKKVGEKTNEEGRLVDVRTKRVGWAGSVKTRPQDRKKGGNKKRNGKNTHADRQGSREASTAPRGRRTGRRAAKRVMKVKKR